MASKRLFTTLIGASAAALIGLGSAYAVDLKNFGLDGCEGHSCAVEGPGEQIAAMPDAQVPEEGLAGRPGFDLDLVAGPQGPANEELAARAGLDSCEGHSCAVE